MTVFYHLTFDRLWQRLLQQTFDRSFTLLGLLLSSLHGLLFVPAHILLLPGHGHLVPSRLLALFALPKHVGVDEEEDQTHLLTGEDSHDQQRSDQLQDGDELVLHTATHWVSDVGAPALHGLRQHADGLLLQGAQRDLWAVQVLVAFRGDDTNRREVEPGFEGGAEADSGQGVTLGLIWEELDGVSFIRQRDDELVVHHQTRLLGSLQMDAGNKDVSVLSQRHTS